MGIDAIYKQLFGKKAPTDGSVIDLAEHGRVGGISTGQSFKYTSPIDPDTGSVIKSPDEFQANDIEESGTTTYIGKENTSGEWWILRIDESVSPTTFQHASINTNALQTTYSLAWTNRATLSYADYSSVF